MISGSPVKPKGAVASLHGKRHAMIHCVGDDLLWCAF